MLLSIFVGHIQNFSTCISWYLNSFTSHQILKDCWFTGFNKYSQCYWRWDVSVGGSQKISSFFIWSGTIPPSLNACVWLCLDGYEQIFLFTFYVTQDHGKPSGNGETGKWIDFILLPVVPHPCCLELHSKFLWISYF